MQWIVRYIQISWSDKLLLMETIFLLFCIKIMVWGIPLKWYAKLLGKQHKETEGVLSDFLNHKIYKISAAIVRSRKVIPWENQCLTEAIAGKILLRQYGLNGTLYFGVRKENNSFTAHAWLRCGEIYVTGRRGMNNFHVVSTFS